MSPDLTVGSTLVGAVGALAEFVFHGLVKHFKVYSCVACSSVFNMFSFNFGWFLPTKVEHEILRLASFEYPHFWELRKTSGICGICETKMVGAHWGNSNPLSNSRRCFFICKGIPNQNFYLLQGRESIPFFVVLSYFYLSYVYIYIYIYIIKGSLDEKLPSYEVLKMLRE